MKPTKENKAKAMALLRAMAEEAEWSLDDLVDPEGVAERHSLNLTRREVRDMETYLIDLRLLDAEHATFGGIGLTQRGLDVAHGEADQVPTGYADSRGVSINVHAVNHHGDTHIGDNYTTNVTGSTVGALAQGHGAVATSHATVGATGSLTQTQHLEHIKAAKKALVDDEERLGLKAHQELAWFLAQAQVVQVESKGIRDVQAEMEAILERVWSESVAEGLPKGLAVMKALAKNPAMIKVTNKLVGG